MGYAGGGGQKREEVKKGGEAGREGEAKGKERSWQKHEGNADKLPCIC